MTGGPLWIPTPERVATSNIERFRRKAEQVSGREIADTDALHRWSIEDPGRFWSLVWEETGLIGDRRGPAYVAGEGMIDARFFPEATLNYAENLIEGGNRPDDEPAIVYRREDGVSRTITRGRLRVETAAFAAALTAAGVETGDRVAAWMPHVPETVIAMLGAASIGAVFTSTSADFGATGVIDRFGQVEPVVLVVADGYVYGGKGFDRREQLAEILPSLPSVRTVVMVDVLGGETPDGVVSYEDFVAPRRGVAPDYRRLPFDHPLYILYSSGTTGKPKCIVHRAGGVLIKHLQEQQHHIDLRPGDRLFYFTTCGWMMWNWLVSGLASGSAIVLYDGNPFHPSPAALFDLVDRVGVTMLGVSAKYLESVQKSGTRPIETHRLETLRTIASTGSPLSPEGFRFVYEGIKADVHLASVSGGTDLCGCFVGSDPTRPVWPGEIQGPGLGMAVEVYDDDGRPVTGQEGELVCTVAFPSMPLTFFGEEGDDRYRDAYFARFPGVWAHGDYARWTEHGGMVILGRSDATLNVGGVRIGTAEIYRVLEKFPEVAESVVVAQRVGADTRAVLFLRMAEGHRLDDELAERIRHRLRTEESPRHVPAIITTTPDIPRTRSGKISELAVTAVINRRPVKNTEALANPETLDYFSNRPELEV